MAGQGFASLTADKRRVASSKGGKRAQASGRAHKYNAQTAKMSSMRAVAAKKLKRAQAAAMRLLKAGFTPEQLNELSLSIDEYIYYGGSKASEPRLVELKLKLAENQP